MCSLDFNDSINWNVQGCFDQSLVLTGNDFGKELSFEEKQDDDTYKALYDKADSVFATLNLNENKPKEVFRIKNKVLPSYQIRKNMLYCSTTDEDVIKSIDLTTGKEKQICTLQQNYISHIIGDYLCCQDPDTTKDSTLYFVDINTGEVNHSKLVNKSLGWSLEFRAVLESEVLVIYDYDAEATGDGSYEIKRYQYGLISQKDLVNGNDRSGKVNMLELFEITKKYKDKLALNNISLTLDNGIYGLLGPNGAGKSTLMNVITGNIQPSSGNITWNGNDIKQLKSEYRSILGYAPQQQGLYDSFSGRRFLSYMAALKGISKKEMPDEITRALSYVNMTEKADKAIGTYSGGMKQRILIAQAILGNPKLIILDEPTAGLDPKERVRIREQIKTLSGDKIILVSTHVVSDIESIANEIILIKNGNIIDRDTVNALCSKHNNSDNLEGVYMHIFGEDEQNASTDTL